MKKEVLILSSGLLLAAGAAVFAVANKPLTAEEALLMANVEAIAQNEGGGGLEDLPPGWNEGSTMEEIMHYAGTTVGGTVSYPGGVGGGVQNQYVPIYCCVSSDPRNACNANVEDTRCNYH